MCDVSATCLQQLLAAAAADGIDARRITAFVADATDPGLAARLVADPADVALIMCVRVRLCVWGGVLIASSNLPAC